MIGCKLIGFFSLGCPTTTLKFFDGMDDDGSELNLQKFMFCWIALCYLVLYLNSPIIGFMIMNGECCFRSSKQWGIH